MQSIIELSTIIFLFLADIDMIEADIVFGLLDGDLSGEHRPIMAHPPTNSSDISLESFLTQILDFNNANVKEKQKGVKLDFKSTDVFQKSLPMLIELWGVMDYPVWINADIYRGPLENVLTVPVDAQIFFEGTKNLPNVTLSTGWTTRWGPNFTEGHYTDEQVNEMIDGIKGSNIRNHITFPVRAGIAGLSIAQLDHLYNSLKDTNPVTFTIWSSATDAVDVEKLRKMIFHFGVDKIYIDVPDDLLSKLQLHVIPNAAMSMKPNLIVGLALILTLILLNN